MKIAICDDCLEDIRLLEECIKESKFSPQDQDFYEYSSGEGLPAFESKDLSNEPEYKFQFFHFNSENERIAVLNKLLDIAEKYGINKLNELIKKEKSIPFEPAT